MCMTNRFRSEANLRNVQWLSLPRIFSALNLDVEGAIAAAEQNGVGILGRKNRLKRSQHSMPPRKSVVLHPHHLISSPWTSHHGAEIKFDRDARQARQISPDLVRPCQSEDLPRRCYWAQSFWTWAESNVPRCSGKWKCLEGGWNSGPPPSPPNPHAFYNRFVILYPFKSSSL